MVRSSMRGSQRLQMLARQARTKAKAASICLSPPVIVNQFPMATSWFGPALTASFTDSGQSQIGGATEAEAYAYSKTLKMYPLSEAANPPPTRFVNGRPYPLPTLPFYDIRALKDIYDIVSVEPVQPRDKVMMGMLATIGIECS